MANKKLLVMSNVFSIMSKIMDHKLNDHNYSDWGKIVQIYLRSINMDNHMVEDPST